jgi:hypothetical protein
VITVIVYEHEGHSERSFTAVQWANNDGTLVLFDTDNNIVAEYLDHSWVGVYKAEAAA